MEEPKIYVEREKLNGLRDDAAVIDKELANCFKCDASVRLLMRWAALKETLKEMFKVEALP